MKRLACLFVSLLLAMSGCAGGDTPALSEKDSETASLIPDNIFNASFSEWANFRDGTGERLNFESDDIKTIATRYVVGWTLDDPKPRKIYQDDIISGLKVNWADSQYYIAYSVWGDPPSLAPNSNAGYFFSDMFQEITLNGLVRRGTEEATDGSGVIVPYTKFFPYKDENGSDFPIIMPYSDEWYNRLKELSAVRIDGDTVIEVQPVGFMVEDSLFPEEGETFNVTIKFSILQIGMSGHSEDSPPVAPRASADIVEIVSIEALK